MSAMTKKSRKKRESGEKKEKEQDLVGNQSVEATAMNANQFQVRSPNSALNVSEDPLMHEKICNQRVIAMGSDLDDGGNDNYGDLKHNEQKKQSVWDGINAQLLNNQAKKFRFIEPNKVNDSEVGKIMKEEVQKEIEYWKPSVLCYVLGANPPPPVKSTVIAPRKDASNSEKGIQILNQKGCLLETKLDKEKVEELMKRKWRQYDYVEKSEGGNKGRILLIWRRDEYIIRVAQITQQYIHCYVKEVGGAKAFNLTVVYNEYTAQRIANVWAELRQLSTNVCEEWIVMGDYNCILQKEDKIGGVNEVSADTENYKKLVQENECNACRYFISQCSADQVGRRNAEE
ncbi:OLC1v1013504C1 [Oldenlandia corymbosa var. corymbosa]|uniref:OLC1v1013504C1 n=1 Tax=Oldenlandia corymbosa var. corymbosa TaxID=529605 RepID=A0AAV1DYJ0_OLDCO|nr:OLC1v1013504C1 [Oldenlandia corymbosa var. corymbosa]